MLLILERQSCYLDRSRLLVFIIVWVDDPKTDIGYNGCSGRLG